MFLKNTKINSSQKYAILKLFNMALKEEIKCSDKSYKELLKYGIVCEQNVDAKPILRYIKEKRFNPNATFYKSIDEVTSKTRLKLFIDQIVHYYTTYGTDFTAQPFIINGTPFDISQTHYIETISISSIIERCQKMIYSGLALSQETIENILIIIENDFEINKIKNKEALCIICSKNQKFPDNPEDILRVLIYKAIGKTLLIKNRETITQLSYADVKNTKIPIELIGKLSEVFYRYKDIFISFKSNPINKNTVNRIRKLAKKNHKPFIPSFWSKVLIEKKDFSEIEKRVNDLNNFKKISLLNTINKYLYNDTAISTYIIRNGKLWVKHISNEEPLIVVKNRFWRFLKRNSANKPIPSKIIKKNIVQRDLIYLKVVYEILYNALIESISKNKCEIVLPEKLIVMAPTSEKSFMGEIPIYSYIDLKSDAIIGINWRGEDGANDLDLSMNMLGGYKIGWNRDYYDKEQSFVYSGDLTSANPESTEILYRKNESDMEGIVKVNLYCGDEKSKFKVFFANEEIRKLHSNYMVNPTSIVYQYQDTISEEKILGLFAENKFIFCNLRLISRQVSKQSITDLQLTYLKKVHCCFLTLEQILLDAGFKVLKSKECILSKDTVIKCLY